MPRDMILVSWNARALMHHKMPLRRAKSAMVMRWCAAGAVVGVQEVHGSLAALQISLAPAMRTHELFFNPCTEADTGGTMLLLPRLWTEAAGTVTP